MAKWAARKIKEELLEQSAAGYGFSVYMWRKLRLFAGKNQHFFNTYTNVCWFQIPVTYYENRKYLVYLILCALKVIVE